MNRIYRVIWSKVKHQYVVVSELARRDGKRPSTAGRSAKAMLAVLALCGTALFSGYGLQTAYADGAATSASQYIAIGGANTNDADYSTGVGNNRTYYRDIDGHTYVYTVANDGNSYWVREGYTIDIVTNERFDGADADTIINAYQVDSDADSEGLLATFQNVTSNTNITTLNDKTLNETSTGVYGGAVNTPTTAVGSNSEFMIDNGSGTYVNGRSNFRTATYDSTTGLYSYNGEVVSTNNLYVLDGEVGVFVVNGEVYTGSVYGRNNEILMTATDDDGTYYSYWGAEIVDPNQTIGSMTISTLQEKFDVVNENIEKIHEDDIKEIQVDANQNGNGGTIGLLTNGAFDEDGNPTGGANIPGTISITSTGGTNGEDVAIEFSNTDTEGNTNSFTVAAGSKVEANAEGESSGTLDSISINGEVYDLATGTTYTAGSGIAISDDDKISVSVDESSSLGFTEDGKLTASDYRLIGSGDGTGSYSPDANGDINLTVQDATTGNTETVTLTDIASASNLTEVSNTVTNITETVNNGWYAADSNGASVNVKPDNDTLTFNGDDENITVTANAEDNSINVALSKDLSVTTVTSENMYVTNVNEENDNSVTNIKYVQDYVSNNDYYLRNGSTELGTTVSGETTGYKADENGNIDLVVANDEGEEKHVILTDIASKDVQDQLASQMEGAVMYDQEGDGYNYDSVTLGGTTYNSEDHSGGTSLTNVAYADVNGEGSAAVNVDLLKDYVDENGGGSWYLSTNGDGDSVSTIGKNSTVDLSSDENIDIAKTEAEDGTTTVTFGLSDNLNVTSVTANNMYVTNVDESKSESVTNVEYVQNYVSDNDYYLRNGSTELGTTVSGETTGYKADENGNIDLVVANDEGDKKHVILTDIASKDVQDQLASQMEGAVMYDQEGDGYNYNSVTLGGTTYNSEDHSGGTSLTNVAYADVNGEGSAAVNVDLLNDTVNDINTSVAGAKTEVKGSTNIDVQESTDDTDGHTVYEVSLKDDVVLSNEEGTNSVSITGTEGTISVTNTNGTTTIDGSQITAGAIQLNGEEGSTITGLTNTTWDGTTDDPSRAATEGQLKQVADETTTASEKLKHITHYDADAEGNEEGVDYTQVEGTKLYNDGQISSTVYSGFNNSTETNLDFDSTGLTVTSSRNGSTNINGGIVTVRNDEGQTTIQGSQISAGDIKINYEDDKSTITGLTNTTIDYDGFAESGRAATEEQLSQVIQDTGEDIAAAKTTVTPANDNIKVNETVDEDGHSNYEIELSDDIVLSGDDNNRVTISGTNGTISVSTDYNDESATTTINGGTIYAGSSINVGTENTNTVTISNETINGLTNTTWDAEDYVSGQAATEDQLKQVADEASSAATAAKTTVTSADDNINVNETVDEDGHSNYEIELSDDIVLSGDVDNRVTISGTNGTISVSTNYNDESATTTINGGTIYAGSSINVGTENTNTVTISNETINGLTNTTWDAEDYVSGQAATEDQLKQVADEASSAATAAKTTVTSADDNINVNETVDEDGHSNYEIELNDHIVLGSADGSGNSISIDGTEGSIILNSVDGDNSIEINSQFGTITGLNSVIEEEGWNTFASGESTNGSRAATEDDLYALYEHSVNYDVDDEGNPDYTSIVLNNSYADGNGGTLITNVAYADVNGDGSAAVNVDLLNDTVTTAANAATTTVSDGKNTTVTSEQQEDGHTDYQVNLNDNIVLGDEEGTNVSISGTEGTVSVTNTNGNTTIDGGAITTDTISALDGEFIVGIDDEGNNYLYAGSDGSELKVTSSGISLGKGSTYVTITEAGTTFSNTVANTSTTINGSQITAGNIQLNGEEGSTITGLTNTTIDYDGFAESGRAATEEQLQAAVESVTTTVTADEKHIDTSKEYAVTDNQIVLDEVNGNGELTGNQVIINDVASATDLGDVGSLNDDLQNEDGSFTSVVDAVNNLDDKVGSGNYIENETGQGNVVSNDMNVTEAIGALDEAIESAATIAEQHSSVEKGNGIVVDGTGTNEAGGVEYVVSLADDFTLGDAEGTNVSVSGTNGTISVTNDIGSTAIDGGKVSVDTSLTVGTGDNTVSVSGGNVTATGSISAGQTTISDAGVAVGGNTYITSSGINANSQKITNVAPGEISADSMDAVNGSQLYQTNLVVANNTQNIEMLSHSVSKLDNRIDRVGAGAAALAALHPLDFDPDAKWDFAAGYGNYRGANAVAVGAYYRPNEDLMFSVGGSMGGGENMVNAGLSVKIGAGSSHVTTSRVAMAKEIKAMRDVVAKQDAQIQKLTAMVNALVGIQTESDAAMFPDVPENHWAYEAVAAMAKNGLVKGYPDGEFKGDRTMTRYEFAQIVYNAIQAGVEVDARLVQEFAPELEFFRIDTVAQDSSGNPTIQRIRVNK